jgi:N-methylhydantoinase B
MSGVVCSNDGDTHNSPSEQMEAKYPVLIERHALRADSGGPGRFRGGLGTEVVVRARSPITVDVQAERMHCPPWGLAEGRSGLGNQVALRVDGQELAGASNAKVRNHRLKTGDAVILRAGGGGGFGPPHERDPTAVAHDVRQGYVSREVARNIYRVEVARDGTIDEETTRSMRAQVRAHLAGQPIQKQPEDDLPQALVGPG